MTEKELQEIVELFELSTNEQAALKQLTVNLADRKAEDVLTLMEESTNTLAWVRSFISQNPALASKIIQTVNRNPDIVKKFNPQAFEVLKKRFPVENPNYYIPPIAGPDPMDVNAALPAALAVALVVCVINSVGRAGFVGVV